MESCKRNSGNLQVSILMKGIKPTLSTLSIPKNPQTLEDTRQAMVLAEQTNNASDSRSVNSIDSSLRNEIMCLRNRLSEVIAIQKNRIWTIKLFHSGPIRTNRLNSHGHSPLTCQGSLPFTTRCKHSSVIEIRKDNTDY